MSADNKQTMPVKSANPKPKWLAITLFVLSLLYLIPEIVFNAKLVEVAGGAGIDEQTLHLVELFGRSISGIGVTLLLADLLLKGRFVSTVPRAIFSFIAVALLVWPSVFFGQKLLVDKLLVEPSSSLQRQEAFFASILRSGLALNAVKIKGLPYDADHATSATEMTFLAMMGGLVYANNEFIQHVEDKKRQILNRYIENKANSQFDDYFNKYKKMRDEVAGSYQQYQQGVKKYNSNIQAISGRANQAWEDVETQIMQGWKDYQNAEKAYLARAEARAQTVAPKIYKHFEDRNRCIDRYANKKNKAERLNRCITDEEKQYAKTLKQAGLPFVEMDYWLEQEVRRTKGETSLGETAMTLGLSAILAGLEIVSGDAGEKDIRNVYTNEVAFYTPRILLLWKDKFEKETGYPMGLDSIRTFRLHPVTSQKVRQRVAKEGISLDKSWRVTQISVFKSAVKKEARRRINAEWKREIAKRGLSLQPNLSWKAFQQHPQIQQRILQAMGERNYVKPMMADWNNKQFYNKVMKVNIQREAEYWLSYIESARAQFEDGAPLAENGKSALRSIIVPPISMSLSLLLVLLTVLKLPFKFWALIDYDKDFSQQQAAWEKYLSPVLSVLLIVTLFVVPLVVGSSKFTEAKSTTSYFLDKFDETVSPAGSLVMKWVLHTQPMVQPIGAKLDDNMQITALFKRVLEQPIGRMDSFVMAKLNTQKAGASEEMQAGFDEQQQAIAKSGQLLELPFVVKTNAPGAQIRVMNIKPKYREGIKLPSGNYNVEVSAPGFKTKRVWVAHNQKTQTHQINISKS
ncbi:carboxypeptidase-like regulatory domain-containing protein [Agarivorans gilvus]|uniref:PEGA domain-containing protein n=1 Tax=Agarivorans gilvus TaxID=680279 RepID=A0ABQ1I7G8_9ALTE|nr:carboxypeptidase-like regulatory domain-containing protein [Agarivorans gilvus]GGB18879.1 hypothetical protein GCM10007414_35350 [Agarivorans gilvus]